MSLGMCSHDLFGRWYFLPGKRQKSMNAKLVFRTTEQSTWFVFERMFRWAKLYLASFDLPFFANHSSLLSASIAWKKRDRFCIGVCVWADKFNANATGVSQPFNCTTMYDRNQNLPHLTADQLLDLLGKAVWMLHPQQNKSHVHPEKRWQ